MANTTKNRKDLKSYFVKNSIPTQSNFEDLIDGMLNQQDDGFIKMPGDPLKIIANDSQGLINFYEKIEDANPAWFLQLNPRTDSKVPSSAKPGFCIADGQNMPRLFIDKATGNLGIGTLAPIAPLDVAQVPRQAKDLPNHPKSIKGLYITGDLGADSDGIEFRHTDGTQGIGFGYNTIYAAGSNPNQDLNLKPKGNGKLQVSGDLAVSGSIVDFSPDISCSIELSGGSHDENQNFRKELTYIKINGNQSLVELQNICALGLNTVILNPDGSLKTDGNTSLCKNHNVLQNNNLWNDWAEWVIRNATGGKHGDIVAVASYDAVNNAPRGGLADTLLTQHQAFRAFDMVSDPNNALTCRVPYVLLFARGSNVSMEVTSQANSSRAPAAKIITTYQSLLKNDWKAVYNGDFWNLFQNGWRNYGYSFNPAQYRKDKDGIVWLRGLVKGGTIPSAGNNFYVPLFTLPEGYRPANRQLHGVCVAEFQMGRIDVLPDGNVTLVQASNNNWLSLEGISFRAAPFTIG
jgi:hypothetical protein